MSPDPIAGRATPSGTLTVMDGYTPASYGDGMSEVYDDWYRDVSDVGATVERLEAEGRREGPCTGPLSVLELGAGTGRLALPIAALGHDVTALDISAGMLDRLRDADPHGSVTAVLGDMAGPLPTGPFDVVFVAYNSLFLLTADGHQAKCFAAVAAALAPSGCFVVEAFVPSTDEAGPNDDSVGGDSPTSRVGVRSLTVGRVVLSVSVTDNDRQRVDGQFVELTDGAPVRLRPWSIRFSTPAQLDAMATAAGFERIHRTSDMAGHPFGGHSCHHVTVYRRVPSPEEAPDIRGVAQ